MIGTDGGVRLWDEKGHLLRELQADEHRIINHAAFNDAGSLLAAGGDDAVVHLIDADTGRDAGRLVAGSGEEVARVGFAPDGARLVAIAGSGLARVWDLRSRRRIALIEGRAPGDLYVAAFSPDGTQILTSDGSSRVALHRCLVCLSAEEMVPLVTAAAHRPLTAAQREQWLDEGGG
jgi:WD40 repeat protein